MRIAAIYDIHGNLPALEAVLREIEAAGVDRIVVGGDVAAGPLPRATIARLQQLGPRACFVRGNADRYMVDAYDGIAPDPAMPPGAHAPTAWAARQLTPEQRDFLACFMERAILPVDGLGDVLFCHATPRSDEEIVTTSTPDERMRAALAGISQRVVVCGHTHMQFDRQIDELRVINAGSVGMPYGEPGAYWALLGPDLALRRTTYDLAAAAAQIRASGYPEAEDFAAENVLRPPSAADALAWMDRMAAERDAR